MGERELCQIPLFSNTSDQVLAETIQVSRMCLLHNGTFLHIYYINGAMKRTFGKWCLL